MTSSVMVKMYMIVSQNGDYPRETGIWDKVNQTLDDSMDLGSSGRIVIRVHYS
jgi:hypothetical protein